LIDPAGYSGLAKRFAFDPEEVSHVKIAAAVKAIPLLSTSKNG
jgi:hypothetical protein